jgi:hypothetical protein
MIMAKKPYNGHESHAAWNVSLWIGNDEGLYRMAREHIRRASNRDEAARAMFDDLAGMGIHATPDGTKYSQHTIRLAMRGL